MHPAKMHQLVTIVHMGTKLQEAIALYKGDFGRLSILNVVGDLVTHAHRDVHLILWLQGAAGEMTIGDQTVKPSRDMAVGVNSFAPHSHDLMTGGPGGIFLAFYLDPNWVHRRCRLDPNIAVKFSGQGTFIHRVDQEWIGLVVDECMTTFGSERCMFGSNFPIEKLWTDYPTLLAAYQTALETYSEEDRENVLGRTAERIYGI